MSRQKGGYYRVNLLSTQTAQEPCTHISTFSSPTIPGSKSHRFTDFRAALSKTWCPLDVRTRNFFTLPLRSTSTSKRTVPSYPLLLARLGYGGRGLSFVGRPSLTDHLYGWNRGNFRFSLNRTIFLNIREGLNRKCYIRLW